MKTALFTISLLLSISSFCQNVDTVNIYKSETKYKQKHYLGFWNYNTESFSMPYHKFTSQDSDVFYGNNAEYIKYYTRPNGKLILEGLRRDSHTYLYGRIINYYHNGSIKSIENRDNLNYDTCGLFLSINEGPGPMDSNLYFYRNGTTKKIITYNVIITSCDKPDFNILVITTHFARNQKIKTTEEIITDWDY